MDKPSPCSFVRIKAVFVLISINEKLVAINFLFIFLQLENGVK